MKKLITIIFVIAIASLSHATIRTVCNDSARPAQFSDIQPAIDAATAGDTIFVLGSQFLYTDFTITKKLALIGAGYNSNNQFNYSTKVNHINLQKDPSNIVNPRDPNGSVITGFLVNNDINCYTSPLAVSNITIYRNNIGTIYFYNDAYGSGVSLASNWILYNNILYTLNGGASNGSLGVSASNIVLQNNIITGDVRNFSSPTVVIDHNVFPGPDAFNNLYFATITNNIFTSNPGNVWSTTNVNLNTFNNNITILPTISNNAPTNSFAAGNNTASGNFVGIDPLFVNVTDYNNFNFSFDYRLQAGSPAHNQSTELPPTDLGIYGGPFPFPSAGASGSGYDTSPLPNIPQITQMNILNSTLQPGNALNVNIKAKVNN